MTLFKRIEEYSKAHKLFPAQATVIVGLSGGPDSVFLLHALHTLQSTLGLRTIIAAHLDHEWRQESAQDALFCQKIAEQYQIPCIIGKLSELKTNKKYDGSKEAYGRFMRRYFLTSVQHDHHAQAIALAHHNNDQQETFFIRLLRGTSLTGLTGIKPVQDAFVRPLLALHKQEILDFLQDNNIKYIIDSTNTSDVFLRNRIRMHVLPALRNTDQRFETTFNQSLSQLQETEDFLATLTHETFNKLTAQETNTKHTNITQTTSTQNTTYHLNRKQLCALHPTLFKRILIYWFCQEKVPFPASNGFLQEIMRFLRQPGNSMHQPHTTWRLVKKQTTVFIEK